MSGAEKHAKAASVAVIGMGNWGTTVAEIVARTGQDVAVYARESAQVEELNREHRNSRYTGEVILSDRLFGTHHMETAVQGKRLLLLCVPCQAARDALRQMAPVVDGSQVIVHCAKGIELGTHKRVSEIIREETMLRKIGVLSGPNIAPEILGGAPAASVVASRYEVVVGEAQRAFKGDQFMLFSSTDVVGLELCGALKNILAIAAGMVSEMGFGVNTFAFLITRGLAEIQRLGLVLGAERDTFQGLAGMGDVLATCSSPLSRNHQVGKRLARGEKLEDIVASLGMVAEGVKTTRAAYELSNIHRVEMPITHAIHHIIEGQWTIQDAVKNLMRRQPLNEKLVSKNMGG